MIAAVNLSVCNVGNAPTFERGQSKSFIDITLVSMDTRSSVKNWRVLETESLNLHNYISFEVSEAAGVVYQLPDG